MSVSPIKSDEKSFLKLELFWISVLLIKFVAVGGGFLTPPEETAEQAL